MEIAGIGVPMAFLAGIVSFLSPCVLPLVLGYVSFVAGRSLDGAVDARLSDGRLRVFGLSICFVAGFSFVFVALGAGASALGGLLLSYRYEAMYVAGAVIILFGLQMTGLLRLNMLNRDWRFVKPLPRGRPGGAFLLGTAFAFGWTPCIGPILGAILTISATTLGVSDGVALLSVFSLGLALPFLLVAAFTGQFMRKMHAFRRLGRSLQVVAGGTLVLFGIAMMTGYLNSLSTWLLQSFSIFQEIQL
jgi:cytochrome c-type biogenesis protein